MLKLENVSALELYYIANCYSLEKEKSLLLENGVKNYQQFKDLVDKNVWLKESLLYNYLDKVLRDLEKYKDREPALLVTPGYDDERFLVTDSLVMGDKLLLRCPTNIKGSKFDILGNYTIEEIKFMMYHTDSKGVNSLIEINRITTNNIEKIFDSIKMYEEQVIRQSKEESDFREGNLFELHKTDKMWIVEDNLEDIILYLIYNTHEELVWGKLDDAKRRLLISSVMSNSKSAKVIRSNLINVISNYTTLKELEKGVTKSKVLNRFIKK